MARAIFIGSTLNCDQIKIVIKNLIECKNAEIRIKLEVSPLKDSRFKSDLFTLKVLSLSFPYHERRLSDSWLVINAIRYIAIFINSPFLVQALFDRSLKGRDILFDNRLINYQPKCTNDSRLSLVVLLNS